MVRSTKNKADAAALDVTAREKDNSSLNRHYNSLQNNVGGVSHLFVLAVELSQITRLVRPCLIGAVRSK